MPVGQTGYQTGQTGCDANHSKRLASQSNQLAGRLRINEEFDTFSNLNYKMKKF
jgi:hypothetical protein